MSNFSECAGNGLTRCLVCNSIGCKTWCPRHTLDPDERDADKARRMRVCGEIVGLRGIVEARDAEIARLKRCVENGTCLHCGEPVSDLDVDHWRKCPKHPANAEIASLRKVVEAAKRWKVAYNERDIREAWDAVSDALAELDEAK